MKKLLLLTLLLGNAAFSAENTVWTVKHDYYKEAVKILQVTDGGLLCWQPDRDSKVFFVVDIPNLNQRYDGELLPYNVTFCLHRNLINHPRNKKIFGRVYRVDGFTCARCERHFLEKKYAKEEPLKGWKLRKIGIFKYTSTGGSIKTCEKYSYDYKNLNRNLRTSDNKNITCPQCGHSFAATNNTDAKKVRKQAR